MVGRLDGRAVILAYALGLLLALGPTVRSMAAQNGDTVGPIIDTVIVINSNVFEDDEEDYGFFARLANTLHIKTRPAVIRRMLVLDQGEPYDSARVAESERALRSLGVFRYVIVDTARLRGRLALVAATGDGWSTRPQANYVNIDGDVTWGVALAEQNFLGLASQLTLGYRKDPDRESVQFGMFNPSFFFRRASSLLQYAKLSDGYAGSVRYGVPFYSTAAPWSLFAFGETAHETVLQFRSGEQVYVDPTLCDPQCSQRRAGQRVGLTGGVALRRSSRDYLRLWGNVQFRREDFTTPGTPFSKSEFGSLGTGLELAHVRFTILQHFNSYARREDVNLSQVFRVGLWLAPRAWGYGDRAGIGPEFRTQLSATWSRGFIAFRAGGNGIFGSSGLDSGRVRASVTIADQRLPHQTWIAFVEGSLMKDPKPGDEADLWLERRGPRLFGAHAFTGTRVLWGTIENRILIEEDFYGLLGIGLAPFVDYGGAWFEDEDPRLGGNVGLALRLGPSRSASAEAGEISVGYRFGDGWRPDRQWTWAFRKGFVF